MQNKNKVIRTDGKIQVFKYPVNPGLKWGNCFTSYTTSSHTMTEPWKAVWRVRCSYPAGVKRARIEQSN